MITDPPPTSSTTLSIFHFFYIRKSARKILSLTKKFIRYSKKKETEVELLIHFCLQMKKLRPPISRNTVLQNIADRQKLAIEKTVSSLHEDLQYDYNIQLDDLTEL